MALRKAQSPNAERRSREAMLSEKLRNSVMWDILNNARTHFEKNF